MSKLPVQFRFAPVSPQWRDYYTEDPSTWRFPVFVYECLGPDGRHLYVGRTKNPTKRFATHRQSAVWYGSVERVVITMTCHMGVGSKLEAHLINKHRPLHNVTPREGARRAWESRWRKLGAPSKYATGEIQ